MNKVSVSSIDPRQSLIQARQLAFFLPLFLLAACTGTPKDDGTLPPPLYPQPRTIPAQPKSGYAVNPLTGDSIQPLVNSLGDTLITSVAIPTKGKRIHPDSVAKPKVTNAPKLGSLKKHNAYSNRYLAPENLPTFPVDQSKLTKITVPQVAKGDTSHYLLNNTGQKVPTGVAIPVTGKMVPAKYPQPTQALPMVMKDGATANIQYLDVEQGMANSFVSSIVEDKRGNLWFGTNGGGVSKYDGQSFTHFTENEGLVDNNVSSIFEDKNGNIWFSTGGGVSKYDGQSFTNFTENEGLINNLIFSILEDKNGNIWFSTFRGGVCRYDGKSFTHFTKNEGLTKANFFTSIVEDKNGNLWFGAGRGVCKYDGKSFTHFTEKEGLSNNYVNSILEDKNGNLWFGTGSGVCKYDGKYFTCFTEKEGLSNNVVTSIVEDKNGNLWFGTQSGGVNKYNGHSFTHFTEKEGLSNNYVASVFADKSGNLWFRTREGFNIYDGQTYTHFSEGDDPINNYFGPLLEDKKGNFWFGSYGAGAIKYDGQSFTHFTEKEGLSYSFVFNILEDKNGNLWFATPGGGLSKYDGQSFTHFTDKEGLSRNIVYAIAEDKDGNLWIGTYPGGVSKYDGQSFTHFSVKEGLPHNLVYEIFEDKSGNLWFGTDAGGVSKYDGKSFAHFTEKEGFSKNLVREIFEDKSGNLWFGTIGDGLIEYDGKSFNHFTKKEGLNTNSVSAIAEDKNGNLWLSAFSGRVSKLENNAHQTSPHPPVVQLRQLYINEALPNYRNPSDSSIQAIQFDSVQAFENYPINPKIPSDQNHLSFQFSAIDWAAPAKIKYSYRLLGLDNRWSSPSEKTLADYRNLPDGKFTLQVRAIGEGGKWSEAFEYPFTILPPWWKTWWAFIIYALLFLGALRTFSLWRERNLRQEKEQLQQKVEERTLELKQSLENLKATQTQLIQSEKLASLGELTAGIAHEIQNPLNFVNNFSELSVDLAKEIEEEMDKEAIDKEFVKELMGDLAQNQQKINHHGKRAAAIVTGMLQHARTSSGKKEPTDLNAMADEYLKLAYHGLRAKDPNFNADMVTDFDPSIGKVDVIPQDMGRVLLNLINNAFYAVHQRAAAAPPSGGGGHPTVTVSTQKIDNQIIMRIKDNGTGIPEAVKAKIFQPFFTTKPTGQGTGLGLSLAYDIVVKGHGGTLEVETKEGEGTEFIIRLSL